MIIFACHASTHMVGAGDTWVAMACGRHFLNHGVDTNEPFSANSHDVGPTEKEIEEWPDWAQWITKKVGLKTVKYWHPTGWINQNWLTHVLFYWLTHESPLADADTLSFNTVVYWKFALYIIMVICVYYMARFLGAHYALSAAFACFALFVGRSFFDIRPAGFSNLLAAVFLFILILTTYRNVLYIWLIVPLVVFWCNVHGGYIYAFIVLVPFIMLHLLAILPRRWTVSLHSILTWAALYAMAYKFLDHTYFSNIKEISPPQPGADWLFTVLLVLAAVSIATTVLATSKKIKNELFYAYHILVLIFVFLSVLPRFFPSLPLNLHPQFLKEIQEYVSKSQLSYVVVFLGLTGLGIVLAFFKQKLVCIDLKGIAHSIAASFVALVAMILFNPFHLTNLTHTFVISVSKHAEKWRTVNEWHPAFEWRNPVGTSFPFLVLYVSSMGLTLLWLYSRLLRPRLLRGRKNELEMQKKAFVTLSKIFGWAAAICVCWLVFIGFSFLNLDPLSFLFCTLFAVILLLSICVSVHCVYLAGLLTLLALFSADANAGYAGRYFYPFLLLPCYVLMHILVSLFSKTINKIKQQNIIFPAATAIVSLLVMVAIFNPLKFGSLLKVGSKFQNDLDRRVISAELAAHFKKSGITFSKSATVSVEKMGDKWQITDADKKYLLYKEGRVIRVYKYKSRSSVWRMGQVFNLPDIWKLRRPWHPRYEGRYPLTYKHIFIVLYIVNAVAAFIWLAIPYSREFFRQPARGINQESEADTYQLPKIDLPLMAIAALSIYMAIRSRRFIPVAAIAACPILAAFIDQMARTISAACNFHGFLSNNAPQDQRPNRQGRLVVPPMPHNLLTFVTIAALVAVLGLGTWWTLKFKCVYLDPWPTDPKLSSVFMRMTASDAKPFYALRFIDDNKLQGKMFNYWTEGGFIAWGQTPDPLNGKTPLQLYMDGRAQAAYMRSIYDLWSKIMFGGRIVQRIKEARRQFTRDDYRNIGKWIDGQLTKSERKVWVVLMPSNQFNTPFVKGLEYHSKWRLIFYNSKQRLFVDVRDPRARKLFDGIYNGETRYPDDFSRNLMMAQDSFVSGQWGKGLDYAIKAFELDHSRVPMQKITYAALREPNLIPRVSEYCKNYLGEFNKQKSNWARKNGFHHRIVAALIAADYLQKLAIRQRRLAQKQGRTKLVEEYTELAEEYAAKIREYEKEGAAALKTKRW
jgi:hypothetical protein